MSEDTPERELRRLVLSLTLAQDSAFIGFVFVANPQHQQQVQQDIDTLLPAPWRSHTIDMSTYPLHERVSIPRDKTTITHLVGLALAPRADQKIILRNLNRAREYLGEVGGPVVIWIADDMLDIVTANAPDLWSWHSGIYDFTHLQEDMPMVQQRVLDHYRNPYDFVPLEETPNYIKDKPTLAYINHNDYSGSISFTLHILTPLCILHSSGQSQARSRTPAAFAHLHNNTPAIPATSFKGMLRSVYEVVTNSTLGMLKPKERKGWYRDHVPQAYLPNMNHDPLTYAEALFGTVSGKGDDAVGQAGRLLFDDIQVPVRLHNQYIPQARGGPKPEHEDFYFTRTGGNSTILGRKFYYHQQDYERAIQVYAGDRSMRPDSAESVPAGTTLNGHIRFTNITCEELQALVYALVLEWDDARQRGMAHKLGYGKPYGLGSIHITITSLAVEQQTNGVPARFLRYGSPQMEDWTPRVPALRDAALSAWLQRPQGKRSYVAFATLARWPQQENFIYPEYGFFLKERGLLPHHKTKLWEYQGRDTHHPTAQVTHTVQALTPATSPCTRGTADTFAPSTPTETSEPSDESTRVPNVRVSQTPPVQEQATAPTRRTGQFVRDATIGYAVQDDETGTVYQTVGKIQKKIKNLLTEGKLPHVTFEPATQDGQAVALRIRLPKGTSS